MRLNVNPTRMELRRLKDRLKTAVSGHKLLKDKSDEMVRRFMLLIKENKKLRAGLEAELGEALHAFMLARSSTMSETIEQAVSMPSISVDLTCGTKNVMGVDVPDISITAGSDVSLPYFLPTVTAELDVAIMRLQKLTEKLLKLAEVEKSCNMLANEIVKNRRRVNALEYVIIPNCQETIKYILMKLDENERSTQIRLMKVKAMISEAETT